MRFPFCRIFHKLEPIRDFMRRFYLSTWLVFGLVLVVQAQSFYAIRRERALILVVGTGSSSYFGELKNKNNLDPKLNINAGLQLYLTNRISARAEVTWFELKGSDEQADDNSRKRRNLSFKSDNVEINFTGAINLFPNGNRYYRRPAYNLYVFGGIGGIYFNPKTEYQGQKYALQPLATEGVVYSRFAFVIPFGMGVRLRMGPNANLAIEGGYRKTFTDYLDDVSTVHPGPAAFTDPIAAALSDRRPELGIAAKPAGFQRGDPSAKDGYFLLNVKLEYYLPGNIQLFGGGQKKYGSFNKKRSSSFYRYSKKGKLRR